MIYLDSSATTFFKPKCVHKAVLDALTIYSANPGRSGHSASVATAMQVEGVRQDLADYLSCQREDIIFTSGCTASLNLAIFGLAKTGGHVIITENEHNSVIRPLTALSSRGITYSIAHPSTGGKITKNDIEPLLQANTYLVIACHISNVNGDVCDISSIGQFCHERGLIFLVDGAQSAGHKLINMRQNHIDFFALSGHKGFYAPQGVGVLASSGKYPLEPLIYGGTGTNSLDAHQPQNSPERYESGTLPTPAILGLGAGLNFVKANFGEICDKIDDLTTYLGYEMRKLPVKIYTQIENSHGVFAFNISDINSNDFANYLNEKHGICVRGGLHCAPLKHKALGTIEQGAVRVSISYFNNFSDIAKLLSAVKSYIRILAKQHKLPDN